MKRGKQNAYSDPRLNRKNYYPVTYFGAKNEIGWVHEDRIVLTLMHYQTMRVGEEEADLLRSYAFTQLEDKYFELRDDKIELKHNLDVSGTLLNALNEMKETPQLGALDRTHGNDIDQMGSDLAAQQADQKYSADFINAILDGTKMPTAPNKAQLQQWDMLFPSP